MRVAALVLAAGASSRLGEPKQLIALGGVSGEERLLERAMRVAREGGCAPVVVVLGASAALIRKVCRLDDGIVVENKEWSEGMGASIRMGLGAVAEEVAAVVLMVCDQPAVTGAHIRALIAAGLEGEEPVGSGYAGRTGVPAWVPSSRFAELEGLRGEEGARSLLLSARKVDLPGGELDVDTRELLELARQRFGRQSSVQETSGKTGTARTATADRLRAEGSVCS